MLVGNKQVRHVPPVDVEGAAWTCTGTDSVLVCAGLLLSVAVKFTRYVCPAWLGLGVNENVPVEGSKTMLEVIPVAVSMTAPPVPVGSSPLIVKCRVFPIVAF